MTYYVSFYHISDPNKVCTESFTDLNQAVKYFELLLDVCKEGRAWKPTLEALQ